MAKPTKYTSKSGKEYKISGGVYTGYTYVNTTTNEKSIGAFDDTSDAISYIERDENGDNFNWDDYQE